jgi:4'-phosphopantetheinyl transferase EntD
MPTPPAGAHLVLRPLLEAAQETSDVHEITLIPPHAVPKRHREFRAGRRVAHQALAQAGCPAHATPILRGERGQPVWPDGWVGAISHADTWAGALVAPRHRSVGVGLDVESLTRTVDTDLRSLICVPGELPWVGRDELRLRTLFSAKESVFKALYPVAGVFLDFHDAELAWDSGDPASRGQLRARLRVDASPAHRAGYTFPVSMERFDDHVLTMVVLDP